MGLDPATQLFELVIMNNSEKFTLDDGFCGPMTSQYSVDWLIVWIWKHTQFVSPKFVVNASNLDILMMSLRGTKLVDVLLGLSNIRISLYTYA